MKEDIKQIIYQNSHGGFMCDDFEDGQIIGLRTGDGLELDNVALSLLDYFNDNRKK